MLTATDLSRRTGPRLADGTYFGQLFDHDKREVSLRVFSDPEIYQLELARIFNRSWIEVARTGEIPNKGDFVLSFIGEDSVIVQRGQDGGIAVMLNVCSHRAMEVCWSQRGNTKTFMCPYHSWVFNDKGRLIAAPLQKDMYDPGWDKTPYGLRRVRCEIRHGRIFATFDDDAVSLEEWMGEDFLFYWDAVNEERADYVPLGPPMEYLFKANWKLCNDQNFGDAYHALGTHKAIVEMQQAQGLPMTQGAMRASMNTVKVSFPGKGHVVWHFLGGDPANPHKWDPKKEGVQMVFPASGGPIARCYRLLGIRQSVQHSQLFLPADTDEETKERMRSFHTLGLGSAVDDLDAFESVQRAADRGFGRTQTMKYNAISPPNRPEGWPDRGEVRAGFSRDNEQWSWWLRYFEMMTADEA